MGFPWGVRVGSRRNEHILVGYHKKVEIKSGVYMTLLAGAKFYQEYFWCIEKKLRSLTFENV